MGWGGRERVGEGRGDFFFQCNKRWKLEDLKQLQQVGWDIRSTGKHHPIWHCKFAVFWWKWEPWSIILASNQNLDAFWEFTWNGWPNWIHVCIWITTVATGFSIVFLVCFIHPTHLPFSYPFPPTNFTSTTHLPNSLMSMIYIAHNAFLSQNFVKFLCRCGLLIHQ